MAHLPGHSVGINDDEWGTKCYSHPEVEATHRICTESDSFGSEYMNLCDICWEQREAYKEKVKEDESLWENCKCGNREPSLISYRDYEEGMHGPVYEHCSKCHEKMNNRIAEEESFYDNDNDDYHLHDYHSDHYQPPPSPEKLSDEVYQIIINYLAVNYKLHFSKLDNGCLVLEVKGTKKLRKLKRRLDLFIFHECDNGYVSGKLEDEIDTTANVIDFASSITTVASRTKKAMGRSLSLGELIALSKTSKRKRRKVRLNKEFVTPISCINLWFQGLYY